MDLTIGHNNDSESPHSANQKNLSIELCANTDLNSNNPLYQGTCTSVESFNNGNISIICSNVASSIQIDNSSCVSSNINNVNNVNNSFENVSCVII